MALKSLRFPTDTTDGNYRQAMIMGQYQQQIRHHDFRGTIPYELVLSHHSNPIEDNCDIDFGLSGDLFGAIDRFGFSCELEQDEVDFPDFQGIEPSERGSLIHHSIPIDDNCDTDFGLCGDLFGAFDRSGFACKLEQDEADFKALCKTTSSSPDSTEGYPESNPASQESDTAQDELWVTRVDPRVFVSDLACTDFQAQNHLPTVSHACVQKDYSPNASDNGKARPPEGIKCGKRSMTSAFSSEEVKMDGPRRRAAPRSSGTFEGVKRRDQLACPFQKRDPHKHQECLKYALHRIKDVKQHIYRRHKQPDYYCARCSAVFDTMAERDEHARRADCAKQPMPRFEGISDDQRSKLNKSSSRQLDHQGQWFEMWDIIFPGEGRPASALVGSYTEEMVPLLRNLWINRQSQIMDRVLDNNGANNFGRSQLNDIMSRLLDCLEAETSGSLAGYVPRSKSKCTTSDPDPEANTLSYMLGGSQTIAPEFDAASDLGFQNPFDIGTK